MILTAVTAFIVLSVLVLVHELGHFLAAKRVGVKVEEFGFGYPPRMIGKKIGGTIYSLNWLPFGGFVRLFGEEMDQKTQSKEAFFNKSKRARTLVIVAGVAFNFLLAVVIFAVVYSFSGIPTQTGKVRVLEILPDSPAAQSGLKANDAVLSINNQPLKFSQDFIDLVDKEKGKEIILEVEREKDNPCASQVFGGGSDSKTKPAFSCQDGKLILWANPRLEPPPGEGSLGVIISDMEMKKFPWWQMPFMGIWQGIKEAFSWTVLIVQSLGKMFFDLFTRGIIPQDVSGPVGIIQITGLVAKSGLLNILQFAGFLSINLMVINILPLPALDGGRLVFIIYEAIARRKPRESVERWTNSLGMSLLILLLLVATFNDFKRLEFFKTLGKWLESIWPF
jgi:regulator of sigma E protease